jgi:septal ring factor EnvC (AmiA/AmiB activator)
MKHSREVRAVHLLQTSADLQNLMAEIRALREAVRAAETTQRGRERALTIPLKGCETQPARSHSTAY